MYIHQFVTRNGMYIHQFVLSNVTSTFLFLLFLQECLCDANLALNKPASQSSTYKINNADMAVDGDINTCSHTADYKSTAIWSVDLQGYYEIHNITIYNREDRFYFRFHDFEVTVLGNTHQHCPALCLTYPGVLPRWGVSLQCHDGVRGRFLRLTKVVESDRDTLNMCEMQIYGAPVQESGLCQSQRRFDRTEGRKYDGPDTIDLTATEKVLTCASQCGRADVCIGFNYNVVTGQCQGITNQNEAMIENHEWSHYTTAC
ncbi:uncharacterized protein LOC124118734 [Haliotis rufescens]|uniref:uncharacterized protein LOC124118734 n=1 Tax=Haliotis rufescens TaxID=6454 RepID=UPI00201F943A|nr:uncharacterized protein LOC124118734 [Haliotis rufescens]